MSTLRHPALTTAPAPRAVAADRPTVLHVRVVAGTGGGPDKTILRSAACADDAGMNMLAAYIHPEGDEGIHTLAAHAEAFGSPFIAIPERGAVDFKTVRALLDICREKNVAVWHAHDYKSNLLGLLIRRRHAMKLVSTAHGWTWDTWRTKLYHHVDNLCLPRYDQVVAVSPLIAEHCRRIGVKADRLTEIPNGIDLAEYPRRGDRRVGCGVLGVDVRQLHLGVIGRLSVEKGVDRAIEAIARLVAQQPTLNAHLHIVGDGPQRGDLQQFAHARCLTDRVTFHGWQRDCMPFYHALDLLILPSLTEGLPNVLLEAMAVGVPVAATRVGGVPQLLDQGEAGVLLDDNLDAWPAQLLPLLQQPLRRATFAMHARERIEQHYTFDRRMQRMFAVYDRVIERDAQDEATTAARRAA